MCASVCLCVRASVRDHTPELHARSSPILVHATCAPGSFSSAGVAIRYVCTSGLTGDVIFARMAKNMRREKAFTQR